MLGGKERVRIFFELPLLADFGPVRMDRTS
jgi:hypothetical protein